MQSINWVHSGDDYLHGQYLDTTFNKINKFACFDLDDTLITTKSGNTFATSGDDWKFLYKNVDEKLYELYDDKFIIVIITNQAGLLKKTGGVDVDTWKSKITSIVQSINVPIIIFAALGHDHYRKPFTTFWDMITDKLKVSKNSFYCGDACGRKTDFSDSDIKFAHNSGIKFMLPENLFNKEKIIPPEIEYPIDFDTIPTEQKFIFTPQKKEMIIMIGMPGSGKSTFVKNYIEPHGYGVINRDTAKTIPKCIKECEKFIANGQSVVIDNTNPSIDAREKFTSIAIKNKYSMRCFVMTTNIQLAKHNALYRQYMTNGAVEHIPDLVYNMYKKKYVEPTTKEGFTEIVKLDYVLGDCSDKYKLYYLCNSKRGH
jgi:bifunctional polynucleotide phosphatase/kinase